MGMAGWRSENAGVCKTLMRGFDSRSGLQKMKNFALIAAVMLLASVSAVRAQALTFEKAYQDYQYNLTVYENSFSDYRNAKNAYSDNKTLALKEAARQKTLSMLRNRDKLMVVYLTAIRARIKEVTGLSDEDKNNIFGKIDPEVNFYTNHQSGYADGDSLETLFSKSTESENQYKDKTFPVAQESLFDVSLGQVSGLRQDHEQIFSTLKSIIDTGVASGKLKIDPFNRWLTDIEAADQKLRQNESDAKTQIAQIYDDSYSTSGGFDAAVEIITGSISSLSQFNEFLTEVLNYIETHE